MNYLIWYNKISDRYNWGSREKFEAMKLFYGEKIVFDEEFKNVSEEIIRKVTRSINKQCKKQLIAA